MRIPGECKDGDTVRQKLNEIILYLRGMSLQQMPPVRRQKRLAVSAAATASDAWKPSFFTEGSGESLTYKVRFNLGTINGVPAANWNAAHTLAMAEDAFHFVVATVTTASGKVTNVTLSVDASAPSEDSLAKNTPPTTFKVILHAIGRSEAKTIIRANLNATAAEVFREGKSAPAVGAEPFERWWRWNIETV